MPKSSASRSSGTRWNWACATIPGTTWKLCARPGEVLHVKVVGLARIDPDVTPELALATIGSITVLGALQASPEFKKALADRIR